MGFEESRCDEASVGALNALNEQCYKYKIDIFVQQTLSALSSQALCLGTRNKRHNWYNIDSYFWRFI